MGYTGINDKNSFVRYLDDHFFSLYPLDSVVDGIQIATLSSSLVDPLSE